MERLMPNLIVSAAQSLPVGSYLYARGLDGTGIYRVTRVVAEENQVYGMLVEKEPLSKPWWHFNRDEGLPSTLPIPEQRHVPEAKRKKRRSRKKEYVPT